MAVAMIGGLSWPYRPARGHHPKVETCLIAPSWIRGPPKRSSGR
jgi:hypothetical protein